MLKTNPEKFNGFLQNFNHARQSFTYSKLFKSPRAGKKVDWHKNFKRAEESRQNWEDTKINGIYKTVAQRNPEENDQELIIDSEVKNKTKKKKKPFNKFLNSWPLNDRDNTLIYGNRTITTNQEMSNFKAISAGIKELFRSYREKEQIQKTKSQAIRFNRSGKRYLALSPEKPPIFSSSSKRNFEKGIGQNEENEWGRIEYEENSQFSTEDRDPKEILKDKFLPDDVEMEPDEHTEVDQDMYINNEGEICIPMEQELEPEEPEYESESEERHTYEIEYSQKGSLADQPKYSWDQLFINFATDSQGVIQVGPEHQCTNIPDFMGSKFKRNTDRASTLNCTWQPDKINPSELEKYLNFIRHLNKEKMENSKKMYSPIEYENIIVNEEKWLKILADNNYNTQAATRSSEFRKEYQKGEVFITRVECEEE